MLCNADIESEPNLLVKDGISKWPSPITFDLSFRRVVHKHKISVQGVIPEQPSKDL